MSTWNWLYFKLGSAGVAPEVNLRNANAYKAFGYNEYHLQPNISFASGIKCLLYTKQSSRMRTAHFPIVHEQTESSENITFRNFVGGR